MIKRFFLLAVITTVFFPINAQKKDFSYRFYGFVRGDLFYNTRASVAPVDGNFYMYPKDIWLDDAGKDINNSPNSSFYTFTTRLGIDIKGPDLGKAQTSAKIETDFGGYGPSTTMLRIRQAYVALDWDKTQVLIGHTWHPLSGSVMPDVLNLSTGAPFNPFSRTPLLRVQQKVNDIKFTAAAIWQLQYKSTGPNGASEEYLKNSNIPELFIGGDYIANNWIVGIGGYMISLRPRLFSSDNGLNKVNERVNGYSTMAHIKYTGPNYMIAAKTMLASMANHTAVLGGYAVSKVDPHTQEMEYTPFRHSTSWINATVGTKWKAGIFAGYTKNLGTADELLSDNSFAWGEGLNIDQLYMVNPSVSYNLPHWRLGVEYCLSTAYYGDLDIHSGKVKNTHDITNHRIMALMVYNF